MRKYIAAAGLCLAFLMTPHKADAAYITGRDLVLACQSEKANDIYSCIYYVAGVIDYHVLMQSLGTTPTIDFCLPEDLSIEKAAVIVMEYLKRAPQHNSFIAAPAVTMALHASFPCGKMKRKKKRS